MWMKEGATSDELYADVQACHITADKLYKADDQFHLFPVIRYQLRDNYLRTCMSEKGWQDAS